MPTRKRMISSSKPALNNRKPQFFQDTHFLFSVAKYSENNAYPYKTSKYFISIATKAEPCTF